MPVAKISIAKVVMTLRELRSKASHPQWRGSLLTETVKIPGEAKREVMNGTLEFPCGQEREVKERGLHDIRHTCAQCVLAQRALGPCPLKVIEKGLGVEEDWIEREDLWCDKEIWHDMV